MREETWLTDSIWTIHEFLKPTECQQYVQLAEDIGFEDALVTSPTGAIRVSQLRNNQRVMFKSDPMAEVIWERLVDFVPTGFEGRTAIGVNEMFRFYRYDSGQQFDWHQDHAYERDNGELSCLTLLVYLNEGFVGGETSFDDSCSLDSFEPFEVTPAIGMALLFDHPTHHKGEPVQQGRKYVLRTDVMYSAEDDDESDIMEEWD